MESFSAGIFNPPQRAFVVLKNQIAVASCSVEIVNNKDFTRLSGDD